MRRTIPVAFVLTLGLLISACNQRNATAQDATPAARPPVETKSTTGSQALVRVNGEEITKNLFALFYAERQRSGQITDDTPQQQLAALNELANFMLIAEDAKARQLDKRDGVKAALKLQRITLLARLAMQERLNNEKPSDDDLKKLYDERMAAGANREYKARHILLKTEDEAKAVIAQLDEGADFAELARSKSTGPSGPSGGDLGWFESSKMVKPFSEAVAAMQDGTHSARPVQTQFGWHVIRREESRALPATEFDEAKKTLMAELQQKALQSYVRELREKAKVEYVGQQAGAVTKP